MLTIKAGGSTDSDDTEVTVMPETSPPRPAVMTLTPPVNRRMASRKSPAETLRSIERLRTMEFMAASQVGRIFGALQQVFQDRPLQRGKLRRTPPPRTRNIDVDVVRDDPIFDDQNAVGQRHGLRHIVSYQNRCKALIVPDPLEQPLHRYAGQGIERAERLIEGQNTRMAHQRSRQRHALPLSAGQNCRPLPPLVVKTDLDQRVFCPRLCVRRCPFPTESDFD